MQNIRRQSVYVFLVTIMILTLTIQPNYSLTDFRDIRNHWAKEYIETALNRGIVSGYADGTFRPNAPVTRAEFAKMINRGLNLTKTTEMLFSDLSVYNWYYGDVSKAVAAGYMEGYKDFTFRGEWNVSRQEAAVVYHKLMPLYKKDIELTRFSDDSEIALWAKESAMAVVDNGYMIGDELGRFRPEDPLTRAEACVSIVQFVNGERINAYTQWIDEENALQKDTIYTGNLIIDEHINEGNVTFEQIVSLGDINVQTDEQREIIFKDSKIQRVWLDDSSGNAHIRLIGNTTINQVIIPYGGTIEDDTLTGDGISEIILNGSKLDEQPTFVKGKVGTVIIEDEAMFRLEAGRIENLMIYHGAKDSVIFQEQATVIGEASVSSPVEFRGLGNIITMHALSGYITYQTEPLDIQHSVGLSHPPRFSEDEHEPMVTFSPKDKESDVDIDTEIWIHFDEPIFLYNGDVIYNEDIEDIIEIRRDRKKGRRINYMATLQGDNQSIKIVPENPLREDETYYIILLDESIEDRDGNENDETISRFRTGEIEDKDWDIDFYPKDDSRNVDRDIEIEIDFNEPIFEVNGGRIRDNDIDEYIEIRRGSLRGTKIDFDAYIDDDQERITIEPTDRLDDDTYYYVIILDEVIEDEDYNRLDKEWIRFETE